jgi:GTP-binding protein
LLVDGNSRNEDTPGDVVRAKKLTNFRSQGEGVAVGLTPAVKLSLERAIEYIPSDGFVEDTPKYLRLRKRIACEVERRKFDRGAKG